jgi:hypothetical protein
MSNTAQERAQPLRDAILVLGMHRSGTSLFTRVVSLMGADLPSQLLPANSFNEMGYWESEELNRIHDELLASVSQAWDQLLKFPESWHKTEAAEPFRERLLEALRRDFQGSSLFVIKDPRISVVAPLWLDILALFDARPRCVICVRNPMEVVSSLAQRNQFSPQKSMLLWLRYMLEAERHTRHLPRCFVSYDDVLKDWRGVVERITRSTGVHWPRAIEDAAPDIEGIVLEEKRHHRAVDGALEGDSSISVWIKKVYAAFLAASRDSESGLASICEQVRVAFEEADLLYAPLVAEHHRATWEAWHLRKANEAAKLTGKQHEENIERLSSHLEQSQAAREQSTVLVKQLERSLAEQKTDNARLLEDLVAQRSKLSHLHSQLAASEKALELAEARLESLERSAVPGGVSSGLAAGAQSSGVTPAFHTDPSTAPSPAAAIGVRGSLHTFVSRMQRRRRQLQTRIIPSSLAGIAARIDAIERSGLFDKEFYAKQLNGTAPADLIRHYLTTGARDDLNPHWLFNTRYYREANPSENMQQINPLIHFLVLGNREKRNPHPMFDMRYYLHVNPDVASSGVNPVKHFLAGGWKERRNPNRLFDIDYYLRIYTDVAAAGLSPAMHYIFWGQYEGRDPGPLFSTSYYRQLTPECGDLKIDPLSHYLWRGISQGRTPLSPEKLAAPLAFERPIFLRGTGVRSDRDTRRAALAAVAM